MKRGVYFWVDDLNPASFLILVIHSFLVPIQSIYYRSLGLGSSLLLHILRILFPKIHIEHIEGEICLKFIEPEMTVFWGHYRDSSLWALRLFDLANIQAGLSQFLTKNLSQSKMDLYLKQTIGFEIRSFVKFHHIVFCAIQARRLENDEHHFIVQDNGWIKLLNQLSLVPIKKVLKYPDLKIWLEEILLVLKVLVSLISSLGLMIGKLNFLKKPLTKTPCICVLLAHGMNIEGRSDLYWFPDAKIFAKDILVYSRLQHRSFSASDRAFLKENGFCSEDIRPWGRKGFWFNVYPSWDFILALCRLGKVGLGFCLKTMFNRPNSFRLRWQKKKLISLLYHVALFEAFFKDHNVKLHFSFYELGDQMSASNLAADLVDAVDVSAQYSNYPMTFLDHGKPHDVYFSWGPFYEKILDRHFYINRYLILTGYPYRKKEKQENEELKSIKEMLLKKKVTFIVSFFDELSDENFSREGFSQIYTMLIQLVHSYPKIAVMVKPKRWNYYQSILKNELADIRLAEKTGRFFFLDPKFLPTDVAHIADAAVAFGLYNTAGLEVALSGCPTFMFNCGFEHFHPFYEEGLDKFVFNRVEDIEQNLVRLMNNDIALKKQWLSAFRPFLEQIDPFNDALAGCRTGMFLQQIFELINRNEGITKDSVLSQVAEKYQKKYKKEFVRRYR